MEMDHGCLGRVSRGQRERAHKDAGQRRDELTEVRPEGRVYAHGGRDRRRGRTREFGNIGAVYEGLRNSGIDQKREDKEERRRGLRGSLMCGSSTEMCHSWQRYDAMRGILRFGFTPDFPFISSEIDY
jgi:hypothetical protein